MDVDLRVVAVKLTNRFRGGLSVRERESTSALLKYTWGRTGGRAGEEGRGQEIAAKQAWRGIKG